MEIKSYGKSDVGRVRGGNEDYFATEYISKDEKLFIVADGMGGHKAGNVASQLGTQTFISEFKNNREKKISINKSMLLALQEANKKILETANSDIDKRGMGTTFSAIVFKEDKAEIIHVGDSRIYLIRNNKMERVTTDHTFVEKMREEGRITEAEARRHPQKNILYMSLGAREAFNPYIKKDLKIKDGDIFLMCSDGLTDMVEDEVIKEYCLSYSPKKATEELIELGNRNGGIDNITVLNIHVGNTDKDDMTHPIKIDNKFKKNAIPYIKILLLFLLIIVLMFIIKNSLKKNKPESSKNLKRREPLVEKLVKPIQKANNLLYSEQSGNRKLFFYDEYYIIDHGTGKKEKKNYFHSGIKIKPKKIIRESDYIMIFYDEDKLFKIKIKK
jgi:protein phosphatase